MFDWLEFGEVSAERDQNLKNYFFDNGILKAIVANPTSFLVLGRKGAGKTAVFQYFSSFPEQYLDDADTVISISMHNYAWRIHELLAEEGRSAGLAYIQSWRFIILSTLARHLVERGLAPRPIKKSVSILDKIFGPPIAGKLDIIGAKLLSLSKVRLPAGSIPGDITSINVDGGEVSFEEISEQPSLKKALSTNIGRLVQMLDDAFRDSQKDLPRSFICFDRLDEAWLVESLEQSKKLIAGLVSAAETLVQDYGGRVRPIIFLREDIFNTLDLNDKNKLRADCGKLLAWKAESLERVILERVNFHARNAGVAEVTSLNELFDREKMRQGRTPLDYAVLRTMVRPRDLIYLLRLAKEDQRNRLDDKFEEDVETDRLECQSMYNAEAAYSEWLVNELKDEWATQFPDVNRILEAVQNNGSTNITRDELRASLQNMGIEVPEAELTRYMRFLFDNSIIGFRVGKSQRWMFKCINPAQGFLDAEVYKIHDGLTKGLNLREPRAEQA